MYALVVDASIVGDVSPGRLPHEGPPMYRCIFAALLFAGCAAASGTETGIDDDDDGDSDGMTTTPGGTTGDDGFTEPMGGGMPTGEVTEVFAHDRGTLYKLDPTTNQFEMVAPFTGCGDTENRAIIDIALDKDSNLYAVSFTHLYQVNRRTAQCELLNELGEGDDSYPTSLSFVPAGTVDPARETLVGFQDANYIAISLPSGEIRTLREGALSPYISSGDIVSIIDGATYVTVKDGFDEVPDVSCGDCLVQVNPQTGQIEKSFGDVGYADVFGLAFWGGRAFGFSRDNQMIEIIFGANNVASTPIPTSPISFFGAGSATSVPFTDPR